MAKNICLLLVLLFALTGCFKKKEKVQYFSVFNDMPYAEGEFLANQYCQSCHLVPKPSDLNKHTWEYEVLPKMGRFLGRPSLRLNIVNADNKTAFADTSSLSSEQWMQIQSYYINEAPLALTLSPEVVSSPDLSSRFAETKILADSITSSITSYIGHDPASQSLLVGTYAPHNIIEYDSKLEQRSKTTIQAPISDVLFSEMGNQYLQIGIMQPNDKSTGLVFRQNQKDGKPDTLISGIRRPVDFLKADINQDGLEDLVICAFGNYLGGLSWYEQMASGGYTEHKLSQYPGALKVYADDLNGDGLTDLVALNAQGYEGVYAYLNQGEGQFQEKALLRFRPSHGTSDFLWEDFDQDGIKDIILVNGDNADYPPILKPYHGLRIYKGKAGLEFDESYFYPINGAGKVRMADFDLDGDQDLACVSYFPDYEGKPEESFLFFEQQGPLEFKVSSTKSGYSGKWLLMETMDFDGDGDIDIVLGNSLILTQNVPDRIRSQWNPKLQLLVLENLAHSDEL